MPLLRCLAARPFVQCSATRCLTQGLAATVFAMLTSKASHAVFAARHLLQCVAARPLQCRAAAIHGDMDQHSRMAVLHDFKSGKHHVLVATDVAARGLDIKSIKSVVNYDAAKEIDTHVHRIGRTGRAGDTEGTAYTLITSYESRFAGEVPSHLLSIYSMSRQFNRM